MAGADWKPAGYTSVSPYLTVDGAQKLIDFLKEVFGAQELRRFDADGRVRHAEVRIGDSVVMLTDAMPDWPAMPSTCMCTSRTWTPCMRADWRRAVFPSRSRCSVAIPTSAAASVIRSATRGGSQRSRTSIRHCHQREPFSEPRAIARHA